MTDRERPRVGLLGTPRIEIGDDERRFSGLRARLLCHLAVRRDRLVSVPDLIQILVKATGMWSEAETDGRHTDL